MRVKFTLTELLGGLAKKESQKRKRSDNMARVEERGATMVREPPTSIGDIAEVNSRASTMDLRANIPIVRVVVASTTPMDIRVIEITSTITSPIVPIVVEELKVQASRPMVPAVPRGPVMTKVAREKEPIMANLPAIEATMEVFPITTKARSDDAVGGTAVPTVVSLPMV